VTLGQELAPHLPFLRRYARALTGLQTEGDAFVRATLQAIVAHPLDFPRDIDPRLGLYAAFHRQWSGPIGGRVEDRSRFASIAPRSRQALLLTAMEGFTAEDAGYLMNCDRASIEQLTQEALSEIERQPRVDVLIIEDEPLIAMDLESLVRDLGHDVSGIAATHAEAVACTRARRPGLVLADIQLADDSSGLEAVQEILSDFAVPVIFITAFPQRLLTGDRPEPAFLITKPFQRSTIKAAVSQALFFSRVAVPA